MKKSKLLSMIASTLAFAMLLSACGSTSSTEKSSSTSEVALALEAASNMTIEELEIAAKEEIGTNALSYARVSSTVDAAATAFGEKYGIAIEQGNMGSKESEMYTALSTAVNSNAYVADLMVVQNASMLMEYVYSGDLLNFIPNDFEGIADTDLEPMSWIYLSKQLTYAKDNASDSPELYNVWQMTGLGDDAITAFSLQDPKTEGINMSWLTMLTSDENVAVLESAYASYFGENWSSNTVSSDYHSVAYFFIEKLLGNVSVWHTSDTSTAKGMASYLLDNKSSDGISTGTVSWLPYSKAKDILSVLEGQEELFDNYEFAGLTSEVEGFTGFAYKMYIQIPETAKYPYTAALFASYLLSEEGFGNSAGQYYGYYSVNSNTATADGTPLADWSGIIIEDPVFIYDNYYNVDKFVNALK